MQKSQKLTLLACQIDIPAMTTPCQRDQHLARSSEKVRSSLAAADKHIDLVVLPELSSIDYSRETFAQLDALAEPLDGASFQTWQRVAREWGTHICFSFARAAEAGPYICTAVVCPDGNLVGYYDKLHLAQYGASMEKEYFCPGSHLFTFEINGIRCAPIICYDIRIPELSRTLVLDHNVDLILHCGAYYRDDSFHTWHPFVITRALENQIFMLSLNRAGANYGQSVFCPPWHDEKSELIHFSETEEDIQLINLDRKTLEQAREDYSFLKDRLQDYRITVTTDL